MNKYSSNILIKYLNNFIEYFLNILYPNKCFYCKKIIVKQGFCEDCWNNYVQIIHKPCCSICGEHLFLEQNNDKNLICGSCSNKKYYFDKVLSVFVYNKAISQVIFLLKFKNKFFLSKYFYKFLKYKIEEFDDNIDYIAPVPMYIRKLRNRGYNQTVLLLKEFEKDGYKNILYRLLLKTIHTKAQMELKMLERKKNLKNSFSLNKKYLNLIKDKNILILDDVFTTGTTANECAKVLKQNGAKKVFILTIAKTSLTRKN